MNKLPLILTCGFGLMCLTWLLDGLGVIGHLAPMEGWSKARQTSCGGRKGGPECQAQVVSHLNSTTPGGNVNYCQFLGNGRFSVNMTIVNSQGAGTHSATVTTDCNCNITRSSGG